MSEPVKVSRHYSAPRAQAAQRIRFNLACTAAASAGFADVENRKRARMFPCALAPRAVDNLDHDRLVGIPLALNYTALLDQPTFRWDETADSPLDSDKL